MFVVRFVIFHIVIRDKSEINGVSVIALRNAKAKRLKYWY